jgi:adenylate cyclase
VGFTTIASEQTAHEIVVMLNGVFTAFDEAIESSGLEKIKTIGDAYMIASGVPNPRIDR